MVCQAFKSCSAYVSNIPENHDIIFTSVIVNERYRLMGAGNR